MLKPSCRKPAVLFLILLLAALTAACSAGIGKKGKLVGSWYDAGSSEPQFILYDDGTCEITGEYGTGTWDVVNGDTLKLTNFYGESETGKIVSINSDSLTLTNGAENSILYRSPGHAETDTSDTPKTQGGNKNSNNNNDNSNNPDAGNGNNYNSAIEGGPSADYSATADYDILDDQEDPDEPLDSSFVDGAVTLTEARPFSDDAAWVKYRVGADASGEAIGIMDTTGLIKPCPISQGINNFSDFSGDYAFRNDYSSDAPEYTIINKSGDVVSSGTGIIILGQNENVFLAEERIRSMTENRDLIGVMNPDGSWKLNPKETSIDTSYSIEGRYKGENMFLMVATSNNGKTLEDSVLYNADNGNEYRLDDYGKNVNEQDSWKNYRMSLSGDFFGGVDILSQAFTSGGGRLYKIDKNGNSELFEEFDNSTGFVSVYKNGILFTARTNQEENDWSAPGYMDRASFRDLRNNAKIDLSQYKFEYAANGFYEYQTTNAALLVRGEDGGHYVGILNGSGKFIFDPVKANFYSNRKPNPYSEEVVLVDEASSGAFKILKSDGTMIDSPLKDNEAAYCSCGYILGGTTYITPEGTPLEPHL